MASSDHPPHHDQHTPAAVSARLAAATEHSHLGDYVLGAVDGTVTTFAVVASVAGAQLSGGVALVLGCANLLADGFSMAAGNYLKARSEAQVVERARRAEEAHVERVPEGEREEIRQIFAAKGFSGVTLEEVVDVITKDRRRWVDTMLTEELGHRLESPPPFRAGLATFLGFVLIGMLPLLPLLFAAGAPLTSGLFLASAAAAGVAFLAVGLLKGRTLGEPMLAAGLETLLVGGLAAFLAYVVGDALRGFLGS